MVTDCLTACSTLIRTLGASLAGGRIPIINLILRLYWLQCSHILAHSNYFFKLAKSISIHKYWTSHVCFHLLILSIPLMLCGLSMRDVVANITRRALRKSQLASLPLYTPPSSSSYLHSQRIVDVYTRLTGAGYAFYGLLKSERQGVRGRLQRQTNTKY